jgi:hypothetical protein
MTPPIGFGTGSQHDLEISPSSGIGLVEMSSVAFSGVPGTGLGTHSPLADYAYRIATLTAGLALMVFFF